MKEAGLTPKADNYPNRESTGLDGTRATPKFLEVRVLKSI